MNLETKDVEPGAFEATPLIFHGADGLRLRADGWGDPEAPPVILLHGGGQTRHAWGDTCRRLAQRNWYAINVDLRGHGDSEWSAQGNYGIRPLVEDLQAIAATLPHKPALIGASMGGMTALAAQGWLAPELGRALVLVDIVPRMEAAGVSRIVRFMLAHQDGFASLEEAAAAIAEYRQQRSRPSDLTGLRKNLRQRENGRYYWHWDPRMMQPRDADAMRDYGRLYDAARALQVPTLLVKGRQSDVVSEEGVREFMGLVPHAEFADVSGAGHMVAGDNNDEFSAAILEFLDRHCRQPASSQ